MKKLNPSSDTLPICRPANRVAFVFGEGILFMEKFINGHNEDYSITDGGKVFSYKRGAKKELILSVKKEGYLGIRIRLNGKLKDYRINRLVAEHFIPNPHNKEFVNHIDGIKDNNNLSNLEWCTNKENQIHARDNGLSSRCKINTGIAIKIRTSKGDYTQIAKEFNVSKSIVASIKLNTRWIDQSISMKWCCLDNNGNRILSTISDRKIKSINLFNENRLKKWRRFKNEGYCCIKVSV
jgi:hypothetical protein